MSDEKRKVYSVSELTRLIRLALEREFGHLWIEGEISNVRRPASGHYYLTIKDAQAQISGVLFRGDQRMLTFEPKDGVKVRVFGGISVYERSGNYQIIIRQMEEAGKGTLQEQFEKLKEKLRLEGLFDESHKQTLPVLPQHVGVVTSGTGAAIHDILNVIGRRFPNLHIVLWPVRVQGEGAAAEIEAAIRGFNSRGGVDALIVGRGGGSLEDLWCFNEERVARAIFDSAVPVISAVGHEIDFTISDFVSDVRAATPSAAAELVVGRKDNFEASLSALDDRMTRALQQRSVLSRNQLDRLAGHYVFREPANVVARHRQTLDAHAAQLSRELKARAREANQQADDLAMRLLHGVSLRREAIRGRLNVLASQLKAMDPHGVLKRGYSITRAADGRVVRRPEDVATGQQIVTAISGGELTSEITKVRVAGEGT